MKNCEQESLINTDATAAFFDERAASWDSRLAAVDFETIPRILSQAEVSKDDSVLDVGAGTGILVSYFLDVPVANYHGVDLSQGMARRFREKFPNLSYTVANFESDFVSEPRYSLVIIFNAFPHFANKAEIVRKCHALLKPKGRFVIAHSLTRDALNKLHHAKGGAVGEHVLPDEVVISRLFVNAGFSDVMVQDEQFFFVMGYA